MAAVMMGMSEVGLAAFGRITGQTAADKIFEEAFAHGSRAGQRCLQQLSGSRTPR